MVSATLHYIHDPLCGWCYGAAPLLKAAAAIPGLQIHLWAGGMMAGPARQPASPQLRQFVLQHARRIEQMTEQPFGTGYLDGLMGDPQVIFDSGPPITAILAVGSKGREMLAAIQDAQFRDGRDIWNLDVLTELAEALGLPAGDFRRDFAALAGEPTDRHIEESRRLLMQVGGRGFPTFALEAGGARQMLDSGRFLGRPEEWRRYLEELL
jgi:putative protein-disulfide isomerase